MTNIAAKCIFRAIGLVIVLACIIMIVAGSPFGMGKDGDRAITILFYAVLTGACIMIVKAAGEISGAWHSTALRIWI